MVPTQNLSAQTETRLEPGAHDLSSLSLPVHLVLEITRGRTRFPRRPVTHSRFLIGAGATCDLRLGGEQMPALHSIITVSGREFAIEAIGAEPGLTVNGRLIQTSLLHDGDIIGIGEVELLARLEAGHAPAAIEQTAGTPQNSIDVNRPLADTTAAELIDLIEHEERQIEEFENRQRDGAQALVDAIMARVERRTTGDVPAELGPRSPIPAPHFLSKRPQALPQALSVNLRQPLKAGAESPLQDDIDELGKQLSSISKAILGSSQRATEREALYAQAADQLLDTQQKLVSQLEAVVDQVQTLKENEMPVQKPRAIA